MAESPTDAPDIISRGIELHPSLQGAEIIVEFEDSFIAPVKAPVTPTDAPIEPTMAPIEPTLAPATNAPVDDRVTLQWEAIQEPPSSAPVNVLPEGFWDYFFAWLEKMFGAA